MPARVLIIDDEIKMGKALKHVLAKEGYGVEAIDNPLEGLALLQRERYDVLLCDLKMPGLSGLDVLERSKGLQPDLNVIMMTAYASAETAVESMKRGAYDYLIKPFSTDELKILIQRCLDTEVLRQENAFLKDQLQEKFRPENFISVSKVMQSVLQRARKVAESNATVLITGESGTGKEVLARAIHAASPRAKRCFVTMNCGAVTESLLEAELFGHKRGSFTGAGEDRQGLFEAADKGTIFLDETGEVSPAMQVKLLRVLQSGEFQRVGDPAIIKVDVRVIAATNRNLEKMVQAGLFRIDLYYRLNVVPLYVPPLRERWEDIQPLIEFFLDRYSGGKDYRFSQAALELMESYNWPGNVRELENAVEHAVVLSEGSVLGVDSLPMSLRSYQDKEQGQLGAWWLEKLTLAEAEQRMLEAAMGRTNNNMTRAARQLGITRRALGYRLRKYGLYRKEMDEGAVEEGAGEAVGKEEYQEPESEEKDVEVE
jgi:DNA-binding NtrC family response regulator